MDQQSTIALRLREESIKFFNQFTSNQNERENSIDLIYRIHLLWFRELMLVVDESIFRESLQTLQSEIIEKWKVHNDGNISYNDEDGFLLFLNFFFAERMVISFNYDCFVLENDVNNNSHQQQRIERERIQIQSFITNLPHSQWKQELLSNLRQTISQSIQTFGIDSLSM